MTESRRLETDDGALDRSGELLAGKYRIARLIGEGGMGQVYEAEHTTVGRRFALKFLRSHLASSEAALVRFRREARAAGALESDHIAAVVDFDTAPDGSPFLVMEYLEGKSLGRLLAEEGPLPVPRAAGAIRQVCRGLEVAHAAGILHRDLKPENLFVVRGTDGSERVKILDFGVAKLLHDGAETALVNTGAAIGTPFYMAPEQARGDKNLDERVDVYAVGVILYELLSGEKPHPGDSANAVLAHVLTQRPGRLDALRSGLPPALVELVHRALAFEPKDRPTSARELGRAIETFLAPEVRRVHSQFELRAASTAPDSEPTRLPRPAPAQRTQDSQSLAVAAERAPGSSASHTKWVAVLAGLAALAGFAWLRFTTAPSGDSGPKAESSAAPRAFATLNDASATPVEAPKTSSASSAAASAPPATLLEPAVGAGRPRGRPRAAARGSEAAERSATSDPAASPPGTVSTGIAASASSANGVRFDAQNPYD